MQAGVHDLGFGDEADQWHIAQCVAQGAQFGIGAAEQAAAAAPATDVDGTTDAGLCLAFGRRLLGLRRIAQRGAQLQQFLARDLGLAAAEDHRMPGLHGR